MDNYHKNDAQDRKHPQPVKRGGSEIGVPGKGGKSGGLKKDSSYAVPNSHQMPTGSAGSFPSQNPSAGRAKQQVPIQPIVPFDQNDMQDSQSAQGGTSQPGAGFGRLC